MTQLYTDFPGGSGSKASAYNVGDLGSIPELGRSPGEGNSYPTLVFRPGEFHGLYSPWGLKESDTTERLSLSVVCWAPKRKRKIPLQLDKMEERKK